MRVAVVVLVAGASLLAAARAQAEPRPWPLTPLPAHELLTLAPSLREMDLALIEVDTRGALKQLSTVTLVAAPPATVRDVVAHPERYGEFVHNMRQSVAHANADGTVDHQYLLDYTIDKVEGRHRYRFLPAAAGDAAAPIEMFDPDDDGVRHYRWEFLAAPGGTLLVLYGYAKMPDSGLVARFIAKARTLEYGLALIPQMTLLVAMKQRAETLAHAARLPSVAAPQPSLAFLLSRGTVASFRARNHRVVELNLVDRVPARPDAMLQVAGGVTAWSQFVPTIDHSVPVANKQHLPVVQLVQTLPLMNWDTTWGVSLARSSVDLFALAGDQSGARVRFDVRALPTGDSEIVMRAVENFAQGSVVVGQLYKLEPLFEYGIDVGFGLVMLDSVRGRAETLSRSRVSR